MKTMTATMLLHLLFPAVAVAAAVVTAAAYDGVVSRAERNLSK